jgi:hypothetical protein
MRRVVRHLFTLCAALSLLLFAAVCVLWVRSHYAPGVVGDVNRQSQVIWSRAGSVGVDYVVPMWHRDRVDLLFFPRFVVSYRIVAGAVISPAILWLAVRGRRLLKRITPPGLCPTCGYDLRAHAAGERCPECGTAGA